MLWSSWRRSTWQPRSTTDTCKTTVFEHIGTSTQKDHAVSVGGTKHGGSFWNMKPVLSVFFLKATRGRHLLRKLWESCDHVIGSVTSLKRCILFWHFYFKDVKWDILIGWWVCSFSVRPAPHSEIRGTNTFLTFIHFLEPLINKLCFFYDAFSCCSFLN